MRKPETIGGFRHYIGFSSNTDGKLPMRVIWIVPLLAAIWAAVELYTGLSLATSAPQQASVAAMASAIAIIPYVGCRALQAFADAADADEKTKLLQAIVDSTQRTAIHMKDLRPQ